MNGYFTMTQYYAAPDAPTRERMARHNEAVLAEEIDAIKRLGNQMLQDTPGTPEYEEAQAALAEVEAYCKMIRGLTRRIRL